MSSTLLSNKWLFLFTFFTTYIRSHIYYYTLRTTQVFKTCTRTCTQFSVGALPYLTLRIVIESLGLKERENVCNCQNALYFGYD